MNRLLDRQWIRAENARAAQSYQEAAVVPREIQSRLLERLDGLDFQARTILDVGAGLADASQALAAHFPGSTLLSIDFCLPMLTAARDKTAGHYRVCGDAYALPVAEKSMDLVYSSLMLQCCEDLAHVFDQFRRVIRPGGLLLLSCPGPDTLMELRQSWAAVDQQPHVQLFPDMHNLGDALLAAGFANPVLDVEYLQLTYGDVPQLLTELQNLGASNAATDRRRSLTGKNRLHAMQEHYQGLSVAGRIPATLEVVYGSAWGPPDGQPRRSGGGQVASFSVDQLRGSRAPKR